MIMSDLQNKISDGASILMEKAYQFEAIFDSIPDIIRILGKDYVVIDQNKASKDLFDITDKDIGVKKCYEMLGADRPCDDCVTNLVYETGKEHSRERYIDKIGKWMDVRAHPVFNDTGEIIQVIENFYDLTDIKIAENKLRIKEQVFDTSIAANSIADPKGIITEVNPAFLQAWGFSNEDEVLGKNISYFIQSEEKAVEITETLDKTGAWKGEFIAKRKDGSAFVANSLATTLQDKNGKIVGYQSSVTDITDRKDTEERVRKSEEKYRSIFETAANLITSVDIKGIVVDCNHRVFEVLGYTKEEFMGKHLTHFIHADYWKKANESLETILTEGVLYTSNIAI